VAIEGEWIPVNLLEGNEMESLEAREAVIGWSRETKAVRVWRRLAGEDPDRPPWKPLGARRDFPLTGGACEVSRAQASGWEALALLMADFHTLVVRDGIDPQAAHREFLKIREYREFISPDIPGATRGGGV
jgi:hypothetical protein